MWRAVRLVVDTGMHYKGWTRQEAIDFFTANAAKTEQDIINVIDRYLVMPGQALAYKIGQLKILELKNKAKKQLGDDFDIKEFHLFGPIHLFILCKSSPSESKSLTTIKSIKSSIKVKDILRNQHIARHQIYNNIQTYNADQYDN